MITASPSPAARGTARPSLRGAFTTPTKPVSKFSSDSSDQSESPPRGEQPPPAVAGPSKPHSPKRQECQDSEDGEEGPSSSDRVFHLSLDDEDPTPKGKGKEPVRPVKLPTAADRETAPSAPQTTETEVSSEQQETEGASGGLQASQALDVVVSADAQGAEAAGSQPGDRGSYEADDERETRHRPMPAPAPPPAFEYPPATYAMPSGYNAPHMTPYGNPSMGWATPNPYAPPFHPAVMGQYMGYPSDFVWSSMPYAQPYAGGPMAPPPPVPPMPAMPPLPGPPPQGPLPPTPSYSGGSSRRRRHSYCQGSKKSHNKGN